jgi:sugar phosphate isomerase/epimerase
MTPLRRAGLTASGALFGKPRFHSQQAVAEDSRSLGSILSSTPKFPMKFAICNETFQDWPFERAFTLAAEWGYTGIEFAPFTMHTDAYQITPQRRAEVRRQVEEAGLETVGLHWLLAKTTGYYLTTPDAVVRRRTSDYLGELARLCRDLGGRIMVLGSPQQRNLLPGVTHDQAMELAADCIRRALPTLEDCGVTLAVEPLGPAEGDFLRTAELGMQLCEMVGSPHCRLHLDVKAMSSESKPIPQIIRESARLLEHFHANDPNRRGPGMGEVDFHPIFQALAEIDYRGWVSVEVFDYEPGVEALARESIDYMHNVLADLAEGR